MSGERGRLICSCCGSENHPAASECWLCGLVLHVEVVGESTATADPGPRPQAWTQYSLMTGSLWMTLAAIWLAVFVAAPGLGILLGIAILPAFVRTTLVAVRRAEQGRPVSAVGKVALFVGSLVTVTISAVIVLVASFGTFCAVCLTAGTEAAIPFALLAAMGTTTGAIVAITLWVLRRWRRDAGRR